MDAAKAGVMITGNRRGVIRMNAEKRVGQPRLGCLRQQQVREPAAHSRAAAGWLYKNPSQFDLAGLGVDPDFPVADGGPVTEQDERTNVRIRMPRCKD